MDWSLCRWPSEHYYLSHAPLLFLAIASSVMLFSRFSKNPKISKNPKFPKFSKIFKKFQKKLKYQHFQKIAKKNQKKNPKKNLNIKMYKLYNLGYTLTL
jgi:hypothetical protein